MGPGKNSAFRKFVYFLAFIGIMWWLFISSSVLDEGSLDTDSTEANILFRDFKLNNPREGWELYADECVKNDTNRTTFFNIVKVVQTGKDGTVTTITSRKGNINENHKRVDLQEDVVAHHLGGVRKIFTDRLLYSYKMKVGSSPGKVRIEEDGSICTGNSMDFNAGSNTGKVVGDVHLVVNPDAPAVVGGNKEAVSRGAVVGVTADDSGSIFGHGALISPVSATTEVDSGDKQSKLIRGIGPATWLPDDELTKTKPDPAPAGGGVGGK